MDGILYILNQAGVGLKQFQEQNALLLARVEELEMALQNATATLSDSTS